MTIRMDTVLKNEYKAGRMKVKRLLKDGAPAAKGLNEEQEGKWEKERKETGKMPWVPGILYTRTAFSVSDGCTGR